MSDMCDSFIDNKNFILNELYGSACNHSVCFYKNNFSGMSTKKFFFGCIHAVMSNFLYQMVDTIKEMENTEKNNERLKTIRKIICCSSDSTSSFQMLIRMLLGEQQAQCYVNIHNELKKLY